MSNFREVRDSSLDRDMNLKIRGGSVRCLSWGGWSGLTLHSCDPRYGAGNSRIFCGKLRLMRTWQWEPDGLEISGISTMRILDLGRICINRRASRYGDACSRWVQGGQMMKYEHQGPCPVSLMLCSSFEVWGQFWRLESRGKTWVDQGHVFTISAIRLADRIKFN